MWGAVVGATSYTMQMSIYRNFATYSSFTTTSNHREQPTSLSPNRTFYWRVKANGTNASNWSDVFIFVSPNPPGVVSLVSPASNSLVTGYTPKLDWKATLLPAGTQFDYYQLQLSKEVSFSEILLDVSIAGDQNLSEYTLEDDLDENSKYYWRVKAFNTDMQSSVWSPVWYFRTRMKAPELVAPEFYGIPDTLRPTFIWSEVEGATSYTMQISRYKNFSTFSAYSVSTNQRFQTSSLSPNKTYYWREKANGINTSIWSEVFIFFTPNPPSVPILVSPANNALMTGYLPKLDWQTVVIPTGTQFDTYQLQVARDASFTNIVLDVSISDEQSNSEYTLQEYLNENTKFYWRVRAFNTENQSSVWSAIRYFRTRMKAPELFAPLNSADVYTTKPLLDWNSLPSAVSYTVQISKYPDFRSLITTSTVTDSRFIPSVALVANTEYFWRVTANGINKSDWSEAFSFYVR
jgi:hypothetical protein